MSKIERIQALYRERQYIDLSLEIADVEQQEALIEKGYSLTKQIRALSKELQMDYGLKVKTTQHTLNAM